jgi:hypothetical protein
MGSAALFGPAGGREVGTRLSARVGPGRGLLPAPTGICRVCSRITSAAVHGRSIGSDAASRGYLGPIN